MPLSLSLTALGVPLAVEFVGAEGGSVLSAATGAWSRCVAADGSASARTLTVELAADQEVLQRTDDSVAGADPDALLEHLSQMVTLSALTELAGAAVLLHSAGVADPVSGRTVALVGSSGTGKTTAARALAGSGLGYVSDEAVGVRDDLTLLSYPKPLSVIDPLRSHKQQLSPDDLGLGPTPAACVLHRVVLLERIGSSELTVEEPPVVHALAALAPHTSYLAELPKPLHRLADVVESTGGLLVARYGEAAQLKPLVDELLGVAPA